jgi:hypothetical protein
VLLGWVGIVDDMRVIADDGRGDARNKGTNTSIPILPYN